MNEEVVVPNYEGWIDAANTATDRLFEECMKSAPDADMVKLYEVLSIASSLCAVAAAIKESR